MYKKDELKSISNSHVVEFLVSRFEKPSKKTKGWYRGKHYLQHTRTDIHDYVEYLKHIKKIVGNNWLLIPTGDEYNSLKNPNGYKMTDFPDYEKVVKQARYNWSKAKHSSMALKKIVYLNLERMGLLERARQKKDGKMLINKSTKRFSATHVRVSESGNNILCLKNEMEYHSLIAKAFKHAWGHEYNIFYELIINRDLANISIEEYAFFVSWIDFDSFHPLSIDECEKLIYEWRNLGKNINENIINFFKENSKGKLAKKDLKYWDWNNWKNEAASIFYFLGKLNFFQYDNKKISRIKDLKGKYKRMKKITNEYDAWHQISKKQKLKSGFEYHHIIPFAWVEDEKTHKFIDNFKNLLYISGTAHNKIPKRNNTLTKIKINGDKLILYSSNKNKEEIELKIGVDVLILPSNIAELIEYNERINQII